MIEAAPRLGMSLTPRYLAGDPGAVEHNHYGPVDTFLEELRRASVSSIELRAIGPGSDIEQSLAALQRVHDAGLAATIHGALPPATCGDNWPTAVPALLAAMERLRDLSAAPCPITLHAYAEPDGDITSLATQTAQRLTAMADWIEREAMPVTLALELNRAKATIDPSVTYAGVLEMQRGAGRANVGICWDFGHTWSNVERHGLAPDAPAEFAAAVIHTHIHDLGSTGKTHWPLTEGRLPLERSVHALQGAGYMGVWNLELSPERFADEGNVRKKVLGSVERLGEAVRAKPLS